MLFAYNSRYGYDYGGGYDRGGSGSRGGYGDERPHGRYMNHPSGNCEVSTLSSRLWTSINIKIVQIRDTLKITMLANSSSYIVRIPDSVHT